MAKAINKKWKTVLILCSIFLVVALLLNVGVLVYDVLRSAGGVVTRISARRGSENEIVLRLPYVLATGGYSVRNVAEDEGEYFADGMGNYDGSLGKYRIMIQFGDADLSTVMSLCMLVDDTLKTMPIKLKTKVVSPEDHGFVLYVGSDTPIRTDEVGGETLSAIGGTIKISIMWEKS